MATDKGATGFCISTDPKSIEEHAGTIDLLLNTVSANHDINLYMPLLATNGTIGQLGAALAPHSIS